jgi:hypothetical protein
MNELIEVHELNSLFLRTPNSYSKDKLILLQNGLPLVV